MSAPIVPGELVDIVITGAKISTKHVHDKHLHLFVDGEHLYLPARILSLSTVSVTRVAPPEWPPQPGDLWVDRTGARWFCVGEPDATKPRLMQSESGSITKPNDLNRGVNGPLTLIDRKAPATVRCDCIPNGGEPT